MKGHTASEPSEQAWSQAGQRGLFTCPDSSPLVLQIQSSSSRPWGQMCSRTENFLEMRKGECHTYCVLCSSRPQWAPGLPENQTHK